MRATRIYAFVLAFLFAWSVWAQDDSQSVDRSQYASREIAPDPTAGPCPNDKNSLTQVKGNLYRWAGGPVGGYSGLVLITSEGALVIDGGRTCTARWVLNEIKTRFNVPVKYIVLSHAHFDHIAGTQVYQQAGAIAIAQKNALEPIIGDKLPTAVPDRIFDKQMTITLGGETAILYHIAPSHSNSLAFVYFPKYKALECTDICRAEEVPFNDFPDFYYDGWIETLDWILKQDVDIYETGHDLSNSRVNQQESRDYIVGLHDQVLALLRKGEEWDKLYRDVTFTEDQRKMRNFNRSYLLNILGMYRWVSEHHRGVW